MVMEFVFIAYNLRKALSFFLVTGASKEDVWK